MVSFVFLSGYSVSFIKYSEKWMREGVRGMDGLREKMNIELRWPMVVAWTRVPVSVWKKVEAFETCFGVSFPCGSAGKESACNAGDLGLIPGLGRSLEEGMATHSSILAWRIPMDRGVTKSQTRLSN